MTEEYVEQNEQKEVKETKECHCADNKFLKGCGVAVLIFLGAFCAFYVLADFYIKSLFMPFGFSERRIEKMFDKNMKMMDDFAKENRKISVKTSNVIHMEKTDNYYKITIDLKAFDNNVNNVHVTKSGNILSIQGRSIKKSKHNESISEFSQSYMFDDDVKLQDMSEETKGNYYIITIPIDSKD